MLANLRVNTRLLAGFSFLVLGVLIVAGVGVTRMISLYAITDEIVAQDMRLLQHISSSQEAVLQQASSVRDIVAQEDLKIHREAKKILKEKKPGD